MTKPTFYGALLLAISGHVFALPSECTEQYQRAGAEPGTAGCRFTAAASSGGLGTYYCTASSGLEYIREYCGDWDDECQGPGNQKSSIIGNPINVATGNKLEQVTDYSDQLHGTFNYPLSLKRSYNSNYRIQEGIFGPAWRSNYDRSIRFINSSTVKLVRHIGGQRTFTKSSNDWVSSSPSSDVLTEIKNADGTTIGWQYELSNKTTERYDVTGKLTSITNRHGLSHALEYQSGRLYRVYDPVGRYLEFSFNSDGYVSQVRTPLQTTINYEYEAFSYTRSLQKKRLHIVKQPDKTPDNSSDNPFVEYKYGESAYTEFSYAGLYLTGIIDENGDRYASFGYDSAGRAKLTVHGTHDEDSSEGVKNNANRMDVIYSVSDSSWRATSINPKGKQTNYNFVLSGSLRRATAVEGVASPNCAAANSGYTFDDNGFPDTTTDWNGNVIDYTYSAAGLETSRIEALGKPEERTIETDWFVSERLPEEVREEGRTINFTYENARIKTRTETDTTSFNVPYSTNGRQRSWQYTYTYHDAGKTKVKSVILDGPRTDVNDLTIYEYNENGWLLKVTNALGHETQVLDYNLKGQPLRVRDANNIETSMTYHPRGWLETRTIHSTHGDLTTVYGYDDAGMVTGITTPDGKSITLSYDTAHRLTKVTNNLGETMELTLDEFGKPKVTEVRDADNNIQKLVRKEFDELGRLWKIIAVEGHDQEIYQYDSNSNPTYIYDSNDVPRVQAFDGLNRLDVITDREGGVVDYDYDARDNLISVEDKNQLATRYTVDGFGFKIQEVSPDRGTIVYRYDPAGNLRELRDGRNVTSTYTYDALNRVKTHDIVGYPDESITYRYDQTGTDTEPNFGIGRLTSVSQAGGDFESYVYDDRGNKTRRTAIVAGETYATEFDYNSRSQLVTITYPSGRLVHYGYDDMGRVNEVTTQQDASAPIEAVASDVLYKPFGPLVSLTYGNQFELTKAYDRHYRIDRITSAVSNNTVLDLDYGYDARGNINSIQDMLDATQSQSFNSDAISRLINASGGYGSFVYDYDPNGNREQVTWEQGNDSYVETYTTDRTKNNRLLATQRTGTNAQSKSFDYSDSGNMVQSGDLSFEYDGRDRMVRVFESGALIAEYRHNALHQRTVKTVFGNPSESKHFHYSLTGTLLGENDPDGSNPKDYIYVGNMLVAMADDKPENVLNETDISVTMAGDDGKFQADPDAGNGKVAFIFNVTNTNNTVTAREVTSTVTYPSGITLESIAPSVGTCNSNGVSCSLGDIEPGQTVSVRVVISQPEPEEKTYKVDVTTATDEANLTNNSASGNYGGDCFIATAAFGSYAHPYLHILREFRDQSLMSNVPGQWFVKTYYEASPPMANWIAGNEPAKSVVRVLLLPLIALAWLIQASSTIQIALLVNLAVIALFIKKRGLLSLSKTIMFIARDWAVSVKNSKISGKVGMWVVGAAIYFVLLAPINSWAGVYFVHGDNLNTPKVMTNTAQQVVWRSELDPFGNVVVNISAVENNIRFPGQYFDGELSQNYNYFRSYDPSVGRYSQSDPIGINGGFNIYSYALENPIINIDPLGLFCIPMWPDTGDWQGVGTKEIIKYVVLPQSFGGFGTCSWKRIWNQKQARLVTPREYCKKEGEMCWEMRYGDSYTETRNYTGYDAANSTQIIMGLPPNEQGCCANPWTGAMSCGPIAPKA